MRQLSFPAAMAATICRWLANNRPFALFLGTYGVLALAVALRAPFPNHYDELAHLSYIAHIAQFGAPPVGARDMFLLAPELSRWFTSVPNYLNHPAGYYRVLSLLLPADGWPTRDTVTVLRLANVTLSILAVACALRLAPRKDADSQILIVYRAAVVFVPMLALLGGAITNDNLALLGGCACVWGARILSAARSDRIGRFLLLAGCVLAALAKLTAAMMTGLFVLAFLVTPAGRPSTASDWRFIGWLIGAVALASLPYAQALLAVGSPAPRSPAFDAVYRHHADYHTYLWGWTPDVPLSVFSYARHFTVWLYRNWNPSNNMPGWRDVAALVGGTAILLLAVPTFVANSPIWRASHPVAGAAGVAMAATFVGHLAFSYHMHRLTGSPPFDAVPRYYFPLALAAVPEAACVTLAMLPAGIRGMLLAPLTLALAAAFLALGF